MFFCYLCVFRWSIRQTAWSPCVPSSTPVRRRDAPSQPEWTPWISQSLMPYGSPLLCTVHSRGCPFRKLRDVEDQNRELLSTVAKREETIHQANVSMEFDFSLAEWLLTRQIDAISNGCGFTLRTVVKSESSFTGMYATVIRSWFGPCCLIKTLI